MKNFKRFTALFSSLAIMASMSAISASASNAQTFRYGDVNMDGNVDLKDLSALKLGVYGFRTLSDAQRIVSDVNGDYHVNMADILSLTAHCLGGRQITGETTIYFDENGNVANYLNGNENLTVNSNGYNADVLNSATQSTISLSPNYFSAKSADGSASSFISPWYSEVSYNTGDTSSATGISDHYNSARTSYGNKNVGAGMASNGDIHITNDFFAEEQTAPFMQKAYQRIQNISKNDPLFQSNMGIDETVQLVNAEITKRADGVEFFNYNTNDPVHAFMADSYIEIDGVRFSYSDGQFTIDGIPQENIGLLNTVSVSNSDGHFDELAVVTNTEGNRVLYGMMYSTDYNSMAALVKLRLDMDEEATVVQYIKPADMATTINFYLKDGILEQAFANPDEMVTLCDNEYDPEQLVFQTVGFRRGSKTSLFGKMNERYQITDGVTFMQTGSEPSIKVSHADTASTIKFSPENSNFSLLSTQAGYSYGITSSDDTISYTSGSESFTVSKADQNQYYTPDSNITYTFGDTSETFTANQVLSQRIPTLY